MVMATNILSYSSIDSLQELNGVKIEEIEKRARPGAYAKSGFLGKNESLKDVLKKDWETVQSFGTTHIQITRDLVNITKVTSPQSYYVIHKGNNFNNLGNRCSIAFKLACLAGLITIVAFTALKKPIALIGIIPTIGLLFLAITKNQLLYVSHTFHKGLQEDIFNASDYNFSGAWSSQVTITNVLNRQSVTIGYGVFDYIKKYGFYQGGGDQNPYRVDPKRVMQILTGKSF